LNAARSSQAPARASTDAIVEISDRPRLSTTRLG
jgi:hypothetical protein